MTSKQSNIPFSRKLAYSLVVTFLFLLLLEGVARVVEPLFFPWERSIPVPAPMAPGSEELRSKIEEIRRKAPPATVRHVPVPMQEDNQRGWSLKPNSSIEVGGIGIRINAEGMRGAELPPLESGALRLFSLGDSSIFGTSVREGEVFSSVAAGELSRAWNRQVVGIIGAVPGHDSSQSLKTLRMFGEKVKPAWVIIGNLWSDVYRGDGVHSVWDDVAYLPPVKQRLRGYALYRVLWQLLSPWLHTQQVRWIQSKDDLGTGEEGHEARVPLEDYIANLRAIVATSRKLGARVAFVVLPAPMDFDTVPPPVTIQAYRYAMRSLAEKEKAPLVDGPALFKKAGANLAYFVDNVHPSAEGHRLLGEELARVLLEVGPPPADRSQYE